MQVPGLAVCFYNILCTSFLHFTAHICKTPPRIYYCLHAISITDNRKGAYVYNSFLCLCLEDLCLSPLHSNYKTKLYFVVCITVVLVVILFPSVTRAHILATSTCFTDKGSWEKILNIPIPSYRNFFHASLCMSIQSCMTAEHFYYLRPKKMSIHKTNWKKHSFSELALLSLLRSKHCRSHSLCFSLAQCTPNSNTPHTLGCI